MKTDIFWHEKTKTKKYEKLKRNLKYIYWKKCRRRVKWNVSIYKKENKCKLEYRMRKRYDNRNSANTQTIVLIYFPLLQFPLIAVNSALLGNYSLAANSFDSRVLKCLHSPLSVSLSSTHSTRPSWMNIKKTEIINNNFFSTD